MRCFSERPEQGKENKTMTHRIFTLTEKAKELALDWDRAIYDEEIETVEEFETYEEAVAAFENRMLDPDLYGVE